MKFIRYVLFYLGLFFILDSSAQETVLPVNNNKGKLYFYWGWNGSSYSRSNIHFYGVDYSFRLDKVKAVHSPSPLSTDYINPLRMTIPQYNFRIGYFFRENWSISFGNDHMKYVVVNGQTAKITGKIQIPDSPYNGEYHEEDINLSPDFLLFEHTDGLNYENLELRHFTTLHQGAKTHLQLLEGVGAGVLFPKTNSTLLGKERNDEFHVSGYGVSLMSGLQFALKGGFFIQVEAKGGYVDMRNIVTTQYKEDSASQRFFFFEYTGVLGYKFRVKKT